MSVRWPSKLSIAKSISNTGYKFQAGMSAVDASLSKMSESTRALTLS